MISKYVIPPTATKDVYFIYDISNLEQFKGDLESGELVNYKKMAIYGNIMNSFWLVNTVSAISAIVKILKDYCLPYLEYIRFYVSDDYYITDFSCFDDLFRYNNFECLRQIGVLCDTSNYVEEKVEYDDWVSVSSSSVSPDPIEEEIIGEDVSEKEEDIPEKLDEESSPTPIEEPTPLVSESESSDKGTYRCNEHGKGEVCYCTYYWSVLLYKDL